MVDNGVIRIGSDHVLYALAKDFPEGVRRIELAPDREPKPLTATERAKGWRLERAVMVEPVWEVFDA